MMPESSVRTVLAQTVAPQATCLHAGALFDRPGTPPRGNGTIVVRDGTVARPLAE